MNDKNKIEAILYTLGKFLSIEEISKLASVHPDKVKETLEILKNEHNVKDSALEILNENERWKLGIKKDYLYLTEKLLTDSELDRPTQETLAIVAYKNPVMQSEVVKIRGNKAYDHLKSLKDQNFVVSEKFGRTRLLKLTPKFFDYFDVVDEKLSLKDETKH